MSASINGFLNLGTGVSGLAVLTPPSGAGYAPQPVSFSEFFGGVTLNDVSCLFGPLTAPWGTLTVFGVTDASGNAVVPPGTLQSPWAPAVGEVVSIPQGYITVKIGTQLNAGNTFSLIGSGITGDAFLGTLPADSWLLRLLLRDNAGVGGDVGLGTTSGATNILSPKTVPSSGTYTLTVDVTAFASGSFASGVPQPVYVTTSGGGSSFTAQLDYELGP